MAKHSLDPRQRLLDAGLKLFANRGYAGTSVQDIIDEASVTKPTLYYYFESKEALFQALVDHAMDERLRLMRQAAPPGKETVEQLTDIIVAVTAFARRQPDLLRLSFAIAFAAPNEFPSGFKKHAKMGESFCFIREIVEAGRNSGLLDSAFSVDELTMSYFHVVQHSVVLAVLENKFRGSTPQFVVPRMEPRRMLELFLKGAAGSVKAAVLQPLKGAALLVLLALLPLKLFAQTNTGFAPPTTNSMPVTNSLQAMTNAAPTSATSAPVPSAITNAADITAPPKITLPDVPPPSPPPPNLADTRPVPLAVKASHPERATLSPIADNAGDPHALDLEGCFELTALRDDTLKINLTDIEVARAQLSASIAALWPSFSATNAQEFIHYRQPSGSSLSSFTIPSGAGAGGGAGGAGTSVTSYTQSTGDRNYTSQSHVTMNYTLFNGGQNYNNVGASAAEVAARRQTLARSYQTIYQDVAQAFYNILQYEGDLVIQHDLIDALQARVEDLKGRVHLGRSRPAELLQAQTDLANAQVTAESQKGSLNAARETLAFYIGIPSGKFKLKDTQKFPTAGQLEAYVHQSGSRPDVLSQLESLREAERNLSVAKGQLWPTVVAQGDYLASQDPTDNNTDATMTLQISMPIFDGGLILAQIHQNHEMVRASALNLEQLQRTADQDTRTAYVNFAASAAQVVVLREATTLAAKNFEAQVDDYLRGVVDNLSVLTALQDYQSARQQLHNANMQTRLNLINLHVMSGLAATGPNADNQALPAKTGTAR